MVIAVPSASHHFFFPSSRSFPCIENRPGSNLCLPLDDGDNDDDDSDPPLLAQANENQTTKKNKKQIKYKRGNIPSRKQILNGFWTALFSVTRQPVAQARGKRVDKEKRKKERKTHTHETGRTAVTTVNKEKWNIT